MDFDDLRTDMDLECPHCKRKFQQAEEDEATQAECWNCGKALQVLEDLSGNK